MRHLYQLLIFAPVLMLPVSADAANCNSNANGNWTSAGTWNCGTEPGSGDEIVIEAGNVVTITSNLIYTGTPMHVKVYGIWRFMGGGAKITMPCNSTIEIGFGGKVEASGTGNSQTIRICNTTYWSATDGTVDGPMNWPDTPMPVELISFKAENFHGVSRIEWITASEQNSDVFKLLRSQDASEWAVVATVAAAGQSTSMLQYEVKEKMQAPGTYYYRLIQLDLDGTSNDLGTISLNVKEWNTDLVCGPNPPESGEVKVFLDEIPDTVTLISATGRSITPFWSAERGVLQVKTTAIPSGQHILIVTDESGARRSCRLLIP